VLLEAWVVVAAAAAADSIIAAAPAAGELQSEIITSAEDTAVACPTAAAPAAVAAVGRVVLFSGLTRTKLTTCTSATDIPLHQQQTSHHTIGNRHESSDPGSRRALTLCVCRPTP
jgi:hypothetical protein